MVRIALSILLLTGLISSMGWAGPTINCRLDVYRSHRDGVFSRTGSIDEFSRVSITINTNASGNLSAQVLETHYFLYPTLRAHFTFEGAPSWPGNFQDALTKSKMIQLAFFRDGLTLHAYPGATEIRGPDFYLGILAHRSGSPVVFKTSANRSLGGIDFYRDGGVLSRLYESGSCSQGSGT